MTNTTKKNDSPLLYQGYSWLEKLSQNVIIIVMAVVMIMSGAAMVFIPRYRDSLPIVTEFSFYFVGMAVCACLYISCSLDATQKEKTNCIFRYMVICLFLLMLMELLICFNNGNKNLSGLNCLIANTSFLLSAIRAYLLWCYFSAIAPLKMKLAGLIRKIIYLGIGANLLIILSNQFLHYLFTIDENGFYQTGEVKWLSYLFHIVIWSALLVLALQRNTERRIRFLLLACILFYCLIIFFCYHFLKRDIFLLLADEIVLFLIYSNIYVQRGWAIERQHVELAEAQLNLLKSQINPHFVYNTLTSISSLCYSDPEMAAELIDYFSNYLRGNFGEISNSNVIPFERELEYLNYYLAIETIRFPGIEVIYDLQVMDFDLPSLCLQPLVENAIRHGICRRIDGQGTITISSYETAGEYVLIIKDDGVGFEKQSSEKEENRNPIGIQNVRKRLQLLYNGSLRVDSVPEQGTVCTLMIPKKIEKNGLRI